MSYFAALEQSFCRRRKLRDSDYERINHVVFRWFLSQRNQNIPTNSVFIREKALQHAKELGYKELGYNDVQASDEWLDLTSLLD